MDFSDFVGLPWRDRGRDVSGVDCYGLVCLAFAAHGVDLVSLDNRYRSEWDREQVAALIRQEIGPWRDVEHGQERRLDAVLIREAGLPHHIGLIERRGYMLHIKRGGTSVIERYDSPAYSRRIQGFFRHEALT